MDINKVNLLLEDNPFIQLLYESANNVKVNNDIPQVDLSLLTKLVQKRLGIIFDLRKPELSDLQKRVQALFSVYSNKVSNPEVTHIVNYYISKYPLKITVSDLDVFIYRIIFDVNHLTGDIENILLHIPDKELFKKLLAIYEMKKQGKLDDAKLNEAKDMVYKSIEYSISDYYYGVYLKSIVYATAILYKTMLKHDFELHLLVTNILNDLILAIIGKKYTTGLNDLQIATMKTVILYLLLTYYLEYEPKDALNTASDLIAKSMKKPELSKQIYETITTIIPKYNNVTDIKYLGLYLEKLGITHISNVQLLIEISRRFKKYYAYILVAYPYLISSLIASKYPISETPVIKSKYVDDLEKYVVKNYVYKFV